MLGDIRLADCKELIKVTDALDAFSQLIEYFYPYRMSKNFK
ncbi:MAG TPA: hypothetical protein VGA28_06735 [Desulfurivibrionaceae bacterium]